MTLMTKEKYSFRIEKIFIDELKNHYLTNSVTDAVTLAIREVLEPNFVYKPPRKQLFPFMGSKPKKLTSFITSIIPEHKCFVDVFGGSGVVLSEKPKEISKVEVYNDINKRLTNLLKVINDRPIEFYLRAKNLFVSENIFKEFLKQNNFDNEIDDALNYFYLCSTSIYGIGNSLKHDVNKKPSVSYRNRLPSILEVSDRFKDVTILNKDFRYILKKYDSPTTLFYLDPPYYGSEEYYNYIFTEKDHHDLSKILKNIKGKFILSYYAKTEIYRLYRSNKIYHTTIRMQRSSGKKVYINEKIICNFEFNGSKQYK